jgi:hypothetical protein
MGGQPGLIYMSYVADWSNDSRDKNGNGAVDDFGEQLVFSIHSAAHMSGGGEVESCTSRRTSMSGTTPSSRHGASGQLINGNVSIYGSSTFWRRPGPEQPGPGRHGDERTTSLIHNNYVGMPATLRSGCPRMRPHL